MKEETIATSSSHSIFTCFPFYTARIPASAPAWLDHESLYFGEQEKEANRGYAYQNISKSEAFLARNEVHGLNIWQ